MRVQHNIMAMNAYRNYNNNNSALSKNLEKLSSGYAINRAGDDAAGLAISEKMRAQITGLSTAQDNAKDGVSLVQTAEGALTEVHDMLNRMYELANKSANGTFDEIDREQLQKEVTQLQEEIDRIADSTNFNGIQLLDGSLSATGASGAAGIPSVVGLEMTETAAVADVAAMDTALTANTTAFNEGDVLKVTIKYTDANGKAQSVDLEVTYSENADKGASATKGSLFDADGNKILDLAGTDKGKASAAELGQAFADVAKDKLGDQFKISNSSGKLTFTSKEKGATQKVDSVMINWKATGLVSDGTEPIALAVKHTTKGADAFESSDFASNGYELGDTFTVDGKKFAFVKTQEDAVALGSGVNAIVVGNNASITNTDVTDMAELIEQKTGYKPTVNGTSLEFKAPEGSSGKKGGLTLQIGDTADSYNQLLLSVKDMHVGSLGVSGVDISTQDGAETATDLIKDAINYVSDVRGTLGAAQNRLEHTMNNLSVTEENITSAESAIRDTDVADEMMAYTKNNILIQSAQAMLAQANQVPQGVLQLLQ